MGLWHLSLGVAAAGCGPLIPSEESDTDGPNDDDDDDDGPYTDTEGPIDTTYPTTTTTPSDTDPFACDPACPAGYTCVDGSCIGGDDCYYSSGGYDYCCYDYCCGYGDSCYYDCYYAEDCEPGSFCGGDYSYDCDPANELPACEPGETLARVIPLPAAAAGAVALAFGNAVDGGGDELLVVQWDEARMVSASGAAVTPAAALPGAGAGASAAASGNGFAVASPDLGGTVFVSGDGGGLTVGPAGGGAALARIVGGDFDGDGLGDVAGLDGSTLRWLVGTGMGFEASAELAYGISGPLARGRFDADGNDDLTFHATYSQPLYRRDVPSSLDPTGLYPYSAMALAMAAGDLDGDGADDIVGLSGWDGFMLLFSWRNDSGELLPQYPVYASDLDHDEEGYHRVGMGDVDGDGRDDLVLGSGAVVRVLFGGLTDSEVFRCYADIPIEHAATAIAVGDLDGDGRADVAFSDGNQTTVRASE